MSGSTWVSKSLGRTAGFLRSVLQWPGQFGPAGRGKQGNEPRNAPYEIKPGAVHLCGQAGCKVQVRKQRHRAECADSEEEFSGLVITKRECASKECRCDQCVDCDRQAVAGARVSLRTQPGKIEVDEDKNDGHLPEVQKHAPIDARLFVLSIEEQTHYKRSRPGHVEDINVPKTLGRQVQIASVVCSKRLADTPKEKRGGSEFPKEAAEGQRTPHGLQTRYENENAEK